MVKRTICEDLVEKKSLISFEKPIETLPKRDDLLPIKVLTLQADQRDYVKLKTARSEAELDEMLATHPEFDWKDDMRGLFKQVARSPPPRALPPPTHPSPICIILHLVCSAS